MTQHQQHQQLLHRALDDERYNQFRDFRNVPPEVRSGYAMAIFNPHLVQEDSKREQKLSIEVSMM